MKSNNFVYFVTKTNKTSPSEEFWEHSLLNIDENHSIENLGSIRPFLCLSLLASWILVVLFVSKGIRSTGKVAYVTATFPYLMLTVLVTRGVTLSGATDGIMYFLTPQWSKLAEPSIWFKAASQLFYSTNIGWGGMITMASYNKKKHNCRRDAIFINFISFFTSLYAGLAVFSIIGFMAEESDSKVEEVIKNGPELAFIVYPRALSLMPIPQLWSVLFFIMLFTLGIGSLMVNLETVMTGLSDELRIVRKYRFTATCIVAVCMFLLALPQVTQGGMYVFSLFDHYAASFSLLFTTVAECVAINWIYGSNRFCKDVSTMLGKEISVVWRVFWGGISPVVIIAIIIFNLATSQGAEYGDYTYPVWGDCIGWFITLSSILPIPIVAAIKLIKSPGKTFLEKYRDTTSVPSQPKETEPEAVELYIMRDN
ncbi:DgyrCDS13010 [Dimorphilus gyrociliatus]|uniref:DgyrCDS13010 n=1 Tax=Dimorphilus gyrociliatus TaxID=2664684 RepID=A0A7I8W9D2_9ANNE|nr:DgyrCDS13010 [Dimorphilus gyrociliatus]